MKGQRALGQSQLRAHWVVSLRRKPLGPESNEDRTPGVDGRCATPLATQNEGSWAEADSQSHGTLMGENVQRSGCPMCSVLWNGDLLHWNGGHWSHVGPLAASMLMDLASVKLVT